MFLQFQFKRKTYSFEFLKNNLFNLKWVSGSINVSIKFQFHFIAFIRKMEKHAINISNEQNDNSSLNVSLFSLLKNTGLLRVFKQSETLTFWTKCNLWLIFFVTTKLHVNIKWMEWVDRFGIIQAKQNFCFHWTFYYMKSSAIHNYTQKVQHFFFFHFRWLRSKPLEYEKLKRIEFIFSHLR